MRSDKAQVAATCIYHHHWLGLGLAIRSWENVKLCTIHPQASGTQWIGEQIFTKLRREILNPSLGMSEVPCLSSDHAPRGHCQSPKPERQREAASASSTSSASPLPPPINAPQRRICRHRLELYGERRKKLKDTIFTSTNFVGLILLGWMKN